jgi:hypothetical protein
MKAETTTAEIMLVQWGLWQRGGKGGEVNILWRVMREGLGASHTTIAGLPHMSPTVELVERFLLGQPTKILWAVNHRYVYESPDDYAAKKLKCSPDTYRARLDIAANNLENYLVEN